MMSLEFQQKDLISKLDVEDTRNERKGTLPILYEKMRDNVHVLTSSHLSVCFFSHFFDLFL